MALAYLFSMAVRMYWPIHFADTEAFRYAGELMINTNDGYYFANGARDLMQGLVSENPQKASALDVSTGLVVLSAYLAKWTPFSLESVILYLPALISSLIVVPIILAGRLVGHTLLGFFAALLGSIAWSYYNRTMVGYYDTDMFSVLLQFSIFYSFLAIIYRKSLSAVFVASLLIFAYPYFYPQGMTIVYAMYLMLVGYLVLEYKGVIKADTAPFKEGALSLFATIVLVGIALMQALPVTWRAGLFGIALVVLLRLKLDEKKLFYLSLVFFAGVLFFGNVFVSMVKMTLSYLDRGVASEGLAFYQTVQTVREAGSIPFSTMANRISGSQLGVLLSLIGYLLLVVRYKPFVIALPMIGVGVLSLWAGLRFTVYAVPIAAFSAAYLFWSIGRFVSQKRSVRYGIVAVGMAAMLIPNITHIIGYKVPTVLTKAEVEDLKKLEQIASPKDYTIAWWDYGYPIWFYSNTNTLIDGGKHGNDNYIVSKILQTDSPLLAANLSRLAVERYVDSNYSKVTDVIFHNKEKGEVDPNTVMMELESDSYPLPPKSREVFLYLPWRMMQIFPTVMIFGNIDLATGKAQREITFYDGFARTQEKGKILLSNGVLFDSRAGKVIMGSKRGDVRYFITTLNRPDGTTTYSTQHYPNNGEYVVIYMKGYGRFLVMDMQTFKSTYIQMFVLGNYDKSLFELVVSSPYTKIYRLKR